MSARRPKKESPGATGKSGIWKEIHRRIEAMEQEKIEEITPEELRDLWYRRALELSRPPDREKEDASRLKLVTFRLGTDRYGIPIDGVRELQKAENITPVPTAPDFIVGIMNLRGNILSVVDIRIFFGLPQVTPGAKARVLVVEGRKLKFGILVEKVDEITEVDLADIKPPLSLDRAIKDEYVRGIVTHRGEVLIVMDLDMILNNPRLVVEEHV